MPTWIRMLRGNKGKRPVNPREPQPERKAPRCPDHLDAEAKKKWKRLSKLLLRLDVLTEADGMALACLCQTWSTLGKAQRKLKVGCAHFDLLAAEEDPDSLSVC